MFNIINYFDKLEIQSNSIVADLGCGVGDKSIELANLYPQSVVCAIDVSTNALQNLEARLSIAKNFVKENVKLIQADLENEEDTPVPKDMFDAALLSNFISAIKHKKAFLWNLRLMMKRGGRILVTDFHTTPLRTPSHQNMLTPQKDVERLFVEAGFIVYPIDIEDKYAYAFLAKKQ